MEWFVEVHAPMDQVFVGPFASEALAQGYVERHEAEYPTHECWAMNKHAMEASLAEFGAIPIQPPSL